WYTGSAGWMYRLIVESLLGLKLVTLQDDARLWVTPCLPADWPGCTIEYRYRETPYTIEVTQDGVVAGPIELHVDGELQPEASIPLRDDRRAHQVSVRLPALFEPR
ncbi:MAG: glycosyl hydrolase family 65 protein, partial [Caldimonas sp.]